MRIFAVFHAAGAFIPVVCAVGFPFGSPCMDMAFTGSRDYIGFGDVSAYGAFLVFTSISSFSSREVNDPFTRRMFRYIVFFTAGAFVPVVCAVAFPIGSERTSMSAGGDKSYAEPCFIAVSIAVRRGRQSVDCAGHRP